MRSFKKFPLVHVVFLDHCMGAANMIAPIQCEAFGILRNEDKHAYYVMSWICDKDLYDSDTEGYCILKKDVIEMKKIRGKI